MDSSRSSRSGVPAEATQDLQESAFSGQGRRIGAIADRVIEYAHNQVLGEALGNMAEYGWTEEFAMANAKPRAQFQQAVAGAIGDTIAKGLDMFGAGVYRSESVVAEQQFLLAQDANQLGTQGITNLIRHFVLDNGKDIADIASDPKLYEEWKSEYNQLLENGNIDMYYTQPGSASISGLLSALTGSMRSDPYLDAMMAENAVNRSLFSEYNTEERVYVPHNSESGRVLDMWIDRSGFVDPTDRSRFENPIYGRSSDEISTEDKQLPTILQNGDQPGSGEAIGVVGPLASSDPSPAAVKPESPRSDRGSAHNAVKRLGLTAGEIASIAGTPVEDGKAYSYVVRFQCKEGEDDDDCESRIKQGIRDGRHLRT